MYSRLVNAFSATRLGSWLVKHVASRLDPVIFRATQGRLTSTGIPTLPMLAVTMRGRKSGNSRTVQLAFVEHDGAYLVVASAMGQERHPAWRYNLEANPEVTLQLRGRTLRARARVLNDEEKAAVWPAIHETIPQMRTYEARTDRNIRMFRLEPARSREVKRIDGP